MKQNHDKVLVIAVICGLCLSLLCSTLLLYLLPAIVENRLAEHLYIREHSESYQRFKELPVALRWSMYFFNVTNPNDFDGSNINSLKFQEVGPYVYDEKIEKLNVTISHYGDEISYQDHKVYTFNQELSGPNRKPTDLVTVAHLALASSSKLLLKFVTVNITMTEKVENIAFKGVPGFDMSLFKCTENSNNCNKQAVVNSGKLDINQIGQYIAYDEYEGKLEVWKPHGTCNDIRGTDGTQFHPHVHPHDHLWSFEPTLCRSFKFIHSDETPSVQGITTMRFHPSEDNFRKIAKNHCFCLEENHDDCHAGMVNLNLCAGQEADMIVSTPYFKYNPNIRSDLGLKPALDLTVENYGSFLDVEPTTGIVLRAKKRLQLNVQIKRTSQEWLSPLATPKAIIPLVWIEESGELTAEYADKINRELFAPQRLATGCFYAGILLGLFVACIAVGYKMYESHYSKD